ncbi:MAG: hypothetical protein ACLT63_14015 [Bacteroides xylanisolvens]
MPDTSRFGSTTKEIRLSTTMQFAPQAYIADKMKNGCIDPLFHG